MLEIVESLGDLQPDKISLRKRERKYSRQLVQESLDKLTYRGRISLVLMRSRPPDTLYVLSEPWVENEEVRFNLDLTLRPLTLLREPSVGEQYTAEILRLVRGLASLMPLTYGYAHSTTDSYLGCDPHTSNPFAPKEVYEAYWLNVYGARMVEKLGRERLLSTPAWRVEELPHGAVLVLTRPTPADFDSEEARQAQARALVHLRPELDQEKLLATLRERSEAFLPVERRFHPDVAELLELTLNHVGLTTYRKEVERLNAFQPPAVSERLPAPLEPDVADVRAEVERYEGLYAEQLIAQLLAYKVSSVSSCTPEALAEVDHHLWHQGYARTLPPEDKELLIAAVGAYLGRVLAWALGGRWVPRQRLDEAAVVVGKTAWLPFLRARHHLQSKESALEHSLTQLFRQAQREREA